MPSHDTAPLARFNPLTASLIGRLAVAIVAAGLLWAAVQWAL